MTGFVQGVKTLFNGPDDSAAIAAKQDIAKQREQQALSLEKQKQDLQNQDATVTDQVGRASRVPRGRRLLLAATGEGGVSSKLGS